LGAGHSDQPADGQQHAAEGDGGATEAGRRTGVGGSPRRHAFSVGLVDIAHEARELGTGQPWTTTVPVMNAWMPQM
jgi:hypothetical protein